VKHLTILAFALTLAAPTAGYAQPAPDSDGAAVGVAYDDLNPNSPHDAAILLHRIDDAATEACGATSGSLREYRWAVRRSVCHQAAMNRAVSALNAPAVTSLYSGA
jgi:UrcA family protein